MADRQAGRHTDIQTYKSIICDHECCTCISTSIEGTGRLFFEYFRILSYVNLALCGENQPHFWLYENVVSMRAQDKQIISRFLQVRLMIRVCVCVCACMRACVVCVRACMRVWCVCVLGTCGAADTELCIMFCCCASTKVYTILLQLIIIYICNS